MVRAAAWLSYPPDTGLLCHLLAIDGDSVLQTSPFAGAVFESFVASELVKAQIGRGRSRELYWFRDQAGLEVDFVVPTAGGRLLLCEAKATSTVLPADGKSMLRLRKAIGDRVGKCILVHRPGRTAPRTTVLAPGVEAHDVEGLLRSYERAMV